MDSQGTEQIDNQTEHCVGMDGGRNGWARAVWIVGMAVLARAERYTDRQRAEGMDGQTHE